MERREWITQNRELSADFPEQRVDSRQPTRIQKANYRKL
jgi:hypothetical protein